MSGRSRSCARPWFSFLNGAVVLGWVGAAHADFAPPPESPYRSNESDTRYMEFRELPTSGAAGSSVRFHIGPALLLESSGPGLLAALDIGPGAVGARLSGSWLRAESDRGLSAYGAELWIDFRHRYPLHPIIGAGASWLHGGALDEDANAGAAVLRATLEYELPIADGDARVGLSVLGHVPAIATNRTLPWATAAFTLGAGF